MLHLPVGEEVEIGRGRDAHLILDDEMLSRRHARVWESEGRLFLEDLHSTNGTYVNGERIERSEIQVGDRVLLGTTIFAVTLAHGSLETKPGDIATSESPDPSASQSYQSNGRFSGELAQVPLPDLLQFLATTGQSGVLIVQSHRVARLFLRQGLLEHAEFTDHHGLEAEKVLFRVLSWQVGTFSLQGSFDEPDITALGLASSTEALLMEGMRRLDEIRELWPFEQLFDCELFLASPVVPPFRALPPELLDTLQLVVNCTRVEAILDHSLVSDLETVQDLTYLVQNGYVESSTPVRHVV